MARQLVMQPLNCLCFLLGLAIISAILGPFLTIAHRELLMVTGSKQGVEITLELSVDKTTIEDDIRSNMLTGRKLAFGDTVKEQKDAKISGSKTSTGEPNNYSTNSGTPSNLKDISSSTMQTRPSMNGVKLEGSTSELTFKIPNFQHRKFPSKHASRNSNGDSINDDWKQKMLEASDEILKFLNKDYNSHAHKRRPVHN